MEPKTHLRADPRLCGHVLHLDQGAAQVALEADDSMAVDTKGLIHGGFVFGLADYAAMLAVNHPNVVLGAAQTRFLKPVRVGDHVIARAETFDVRGRKHEVRVEVSVGAARVFEGSFTCRGLEGVGSI